MKIKRPPPPREEAVPVAPALPRAEGRQAGRHAAHERCFAPPFTESAREGVCLDALICENLCDDCGTPNSVQGCTCVRRGRRKGGVKNSDINISDEEYLPRRKSRYCPSRVADGVPRRSKRLAKRQERTRSYRTRLEDSSQHNVQCVMERTKQSCARTLNASWMT